VNQIKPEGKGLVHSQFTMSKHYGQNPRGGEFCLCLREIVMKPQAGRQFYRHRRRSLFYVQFTDPVTRKRLPALSTGKVTRDDALLVVYDWMKTRCIEEKRRGLPEKLAVEQLLTSLK
jgi:hypothetical protein